MANHKSAAKRHRQSLVRNLRNRMMRTRVKNAVKSVRNAIKAEDKAAASAALLVAMSTLDKAASKKTLHWKNAARRISRLSRAVNKI